MADFFIKASEISNLTDARYFAAQGVEWLGFNLDENNPEALSQIQFLAIKDWIAGPKIVGEFASVTDIEQLNQYIDSLKLQAVQVGQFLEAEHLKNIRPGTKLFYEQILEKKEDILNLRNKWEKLSPFVHYFVINIAKNNISWNSLNSDSEIINCLTQLINDFPVILSFTPEKNEISEILSLKNLLGLSLKGGSELKTGMKSFEDYDFIFEYLEENNIY
jgi:phosphoribosylanthranilate isomerase